jgi:hypothetical protein
MTLRKHQREIVEACREILEGKPVREMNRGELERVWVWLRKEYGGRL